MTHILPLALIVASCVAPMHAPAEPIQLPVRVHLVQSTSDRLRTTLGDDDVRALFQVANTIWKQASIEWRIESVRRVESDRGAAFDSLIAGLVRPTGDRLVDFLPRGNLRASGWNLFLIGDFGRIAGGMYRAEIAGVVLAQRGVGVELPPDGRGGATLAHELGHSLGLDHVPCDSTRNIMANACWRIDAPSTLTAEQMRQAVQQARNGIPVGLTQAERPERVGRTY